jgi:hypothetical protein
VNITLMRLAGVERKLERIAQALELLLAEHYGVHVRAPTADTTGGEPELFYTTDERSAVHELMDAWRRDGMEIPDDPETVDEILKALRETAAR